MNDIMEKNSKTILLCATQRSGSTMICEDMWKWSLGKPEEHFLKILNGTNYADCDQDRSHFQKILNSATSENGITSIKVMSNYTMRLCQKIKGLHSQLKSKTIFGPLYGQFEGALWVWIRRNNAIKQAISRVMARHTGVNHATASKSQNHHVGNLLQGYSNKYNEHVPYSYEEIESEVLLISYENSLWSVFFEGNNIKPFQLFYEDCIIDKSYIKQFSRIVSSKLEKSGFEPSLVKLYNQRSQQFYNQFIKEMRLKIAI